MREVKDWSEITIGQYQEMMMIQTDKQITRFIEMISIALNCDPQEIRDMPMSDYKSLQEKMSFISKEPQTDIRTTFELNGREYGLIPDMNLVTAGVFLDAEQFKLDPMANLHYTVALIYRPIVSKDEDGYKIAEHKAEGFEARAELFRDNLSIEIVLGAVLFFSLLVMELSIDLLTSLEQKMKKDEKMMKKTMTQAATKKRKRKPSTETGASTTNS
jgi:hypothetical protein